jgi:hypothetical protein
MAGSASGAGSAGDATVIIRVGEFTEDEQVEYRRRTDAAAISAAEVDAMRHQLGVDADGRPLPEPTGTKRKIAKAEEDLAAAHDANAEAEHELERVTAEAAKAAAELAHYETQMRQAQADRDRS